MQGAELQRLRKSEDLTQRDLAELLGVSNSIVSDWERGKRYPSRNNQRKLEKLYGKRIDQLIDDTA